MRFLDFPSLRTRALACAAAALVWAPGTAFALTAVKASDDATSISAAVWTTPTNIRTDNGIYAIWAGTTQNWLTVKTFGFAIPTSSLIDGIEVMVNGNGDGNSTGQRTFDMALTKDGTNPVGLAKTGALPKTTDADVFVSTPLAGWDTTWTAAEINNANFGVMIRDNDNKNNQMNFDYMRVTVTYRTVDTITVTPTAQVPANPAQGSTFSAIRLALATDQFDANWTAITVTKTGTIADGDITSVRIYRDANANGVYDAGTDTAVSAASTFTGGTSAITLSAAENITTTSKTYFVVYTLAALAANGTTVGAQIGAGALTVTAPDLLAATNLPASSGNGTVADAPDTVTITRTDRAPGTVAQGTANMETQYLSMVTDNETATWTAITVKKLGTIPDTDITAVTIYDDAGGTANQWDATDAAISAGATFTGGSAAITLTVPQTITTTPKVYHIIYTLSSTAQVAATVGSRLNAASDVTLSGVDLVAGTYPLDSTTPAVTDVADTVTAAHTDTPPGVGYVLQGQQYAPMKFTLATGTDEATWTGLTVTAQGTAADADIDDVDIYYDTGNGTWGGEDTLISNAAAEPFSGGSVALTLASAQTITTSPKTYHIVLKVNAAANTAATTGAGINAAGDIALAGVDTVAAGGYPKNSSATNIDPPGNTVTMSAPTSVAPGTANQGAADQALLRFTMVSSPGTASWTDLAVTKTGTLPDADISTVKIYRDDGTTADSFDGSDTLISPALTTFSGGAAAITLSSPESVTTSPQKYFVVYSFDSFATTGTTVGAELTSEAAFSITPPDLMTASNFPGNSTNLTISDVSDALTVVAADQAPGTAVQGNSYSALRLRLSTNQDQALWTAITVHKTGTLADGDVTARIYKDANANGTYDAGTDTAMSGATAFSAGAAAITLTAPENQTTSTQDYFVVYTLSTLAVVGNSVDAQVTQADITLAGGVDTVSAFTGDSAATTVTDLGDTATMTPTDFAVASVAQGNANLATQRISLVTDAETATWTGVTVTKTGTLADAGVSAVTIYDDSGGTPNAWDATDTPVSAGTVFSGGSAAVTLTPSQTLTTSAQVYHIVYSITTTATVGATIGSELTSNAALVVSGTDLVAATNFPANSTNSTVTDTADTITVTPTDTAPANIPQGGTDDFLRLSLATNDDEAVWTAITVTRSGTLPDAQIDSVMIYLDDGDGSFNAGTDTLISPAITTFTGGSAAITLSAAQTINTTPKVYFVVLDLNNAATVTNTVAATVASGALTATAPDTVATTNLPANSTTISVVAAPTITCSRVDLTPANVGQGADYATQRLDCVTDLGSAQISAIKVTLAGTINRTDISSVKIYHDDNGSGDYDPTDSIHGSGTFGGNGTVVITLTPAHDVTTTPGSLFIVYTLNPAVGTGVTAGSSVAAAADVTAVAPALVAATNFPLTSSNATTAVPDYGVSITAGTIDLGLVPIAQDYIVTTGVSVTSVGNMPQHYSIRATTTTAGSPWVVSLTSGALDALTVQALFNAALPADGDFADNDKLLDTDTLCTGGPFEGDRVCRSVGPSAVRTLWTRLGLPELSSTDAQQDIQITVTAVPP